MRIFIGVDTRQPVAYTVLQNSIIRRASRPVQVTPLLISQLPIKRQGLTEFTFSRYLCPFLCNYDGISLFLDADMLVLCDVFELAEILPSAPVSVVKNPALRFEWPSLMLFNNNLCWNLTPEYIENENNSPQTLKWAKEVGELPSQYNHCIGYDKPRDDAKIVHFTQGIPVFEETRDSEYGDLYRQELNMCRATASWVEIMGKSVHAQVVRERLNAAHGNN